MMPFKEVEESGFRGNFGAFMQIVERSAKGYLIELLTGPL